MVKSGVVALMILGCALVSCQESGPKAEEQKGAKLYATYCQSCHMEDGAGVPGLNAPLAGSSYVQGDKEMLVTIVMKGSAAFGENTERPYRNIMAPITGITDKDLADVLSYVRSHFGNNAAPLTPEEVRQIRDKLN